MLGQSKKNRFTLNGTIRTDYSGYIYLNYQNKKDSCLVLNKKFQFKGNMKITDVAYFNTNNPTSMEKDFYLENENIEMDISITAKNINGYKVDFIKINSILGTKTSLIEKEYEDFKLKHQNDKDWIDKNYQKLESIVLKYPNNRFTGDLLTKTSWDSIIHLKKMQQLYTKLNLKSQRKSTMDVLRKNIFPIETSMTGKLIYDFKLPNKNEEYISTNQFRGSILFIDFWASWCAPCRKQIPEIKQMYEKFKDENFNILSISLDKDKEKWLIAIEKEKMLWYNVIERKEFLSKIVENYNVDAIPTSFLIDENGLIIAKNPSMKVLEEYLLKKQKK